MGYSAPRGTVDILPGQSEKWIKLEQLLRTIAANYNVKEWEHQFLNMLNYLTELWGIQVMSFLKNVYFPR